MYIEVSVELKGLYPVLNYCVMRLLVCLVILCFCQAGISQSFEKTFVRTDKDLYQPADTLWFKGYLFDRKNMIADSSLNLHVFLNDEFGKKVADSSWPIVNGLCDGYLITPQTEGRYFLQALTMNMMNLPLSARYQKEVFVRSPLVDVVKIEAVLNQETFSPGEEIVADLKVALSAKEVAANQRLIYELWAGQERLERKRFKTNKEGEYRLNQLFVPAVKDELTLLITTANADIGRPSTLSLPIEVAPNDLDLQFMPEGGHMVEGLNGKVAFKALSNTGAPIDIAGEIQDAMGTVIQKATSFHKGMGYFYLRPKAENYYFKITSPAGIDSLYQLPYARPSGHMISLIDNDDQRLIKVSGNSRLYDSLHIVVRQYGSIVDKIACRGNGVEFLKLQDKSLDVGPVKISLENRIGQILSERLFFSQSVQSLRINISLDKTEYLPRDKVRARIKVTTKFGRPVKGNFSFAAIDDTQNPSPKPDQPHLLAYVLLDSELTGTIPTPNFYFTKSDSAIKALDLVMLTHGWRDYESEEFVNYEVLSGSLVHRQRKKKILADRSISIFNTTNFRESIIQTDSTGRFRIPSHHFKYKGDSFIVVAKAEGKKEKPNMLLDTSNKERFSQFKKQIIANVKDGLTYDYSIYQKRNKLRFDRFGNTLLLNSVEVFGKAIRDSCTLDDRMFRPPWKTKLRGELDLDETDALQVLKQVSNKISGFGDVNVYSPKGTRTLARDALLSLEYFRKATEVNGQRKITSFPLYYFAYINCESTFTFTPNRNMSELVGALDMSNIESIAVLDPLYTDGPGDRPFGQIYINTINDVVVRKPYYQKFFTYTTKPNQRARFYKPVYETEEAKASPIPDLRTTIHWEPTVMTDENGVAVVEFYNADRDNRIRITVEGLGEKQRFGFAQKDYRVLMPASKLGN